MTDQFLCSFVLDILLENYEDREGRRFPRQNSGYPTCEASLEFLSIQGRAWKQSQTDVLKPVTEIISQG